MDLIRCKDYLLQTHLAALMHNERPNAYCLQSNPGVGKTEGVFQYVEMLAQALNKPVGMVDFMIATITSPDARGFMIPTRNADGGPPNTVFSRPPWMPANDNLWVCEPTGNPDDPVAWYEPGEWQYDLPEDGVVFLDEWGQGEDDVKKPMADLLLNGRVGNWKLTKRWRAIAATNRTADRSGVLRELMFIVNRRGLLNVEGRLNPWLVWVETQREWKRPHYLTISFARSHPGVVFRSDVPEGTDQFCTPRSLVKMDYDLRGIRSKALAEQGHLLDLKDPIAHELVASWIGASAAGQYMAHMKYADQLPDIEDVIKDPMRAKLPTGQDGQMVCVFKLVEHISQDVAAPFIKYISRMHQDMGVLGVNTIVADPRRAKYVYPTAEYRDYQRKNKNVLIAAHG